MNSYQLIDQYIQNGDFPQLVSTLKTIPISDLADFNLYSKDIIMRVMNSGNFKSANIHMIELAIEKRQRTHLLKSCIEQLLEYMLTDQFDKYMKVLSIAKQTGGFHSDKIAPIITTWHDHHIDNFEYIRAILIDDGNNIFHWLGAFEMIARLSVHTAIEFLSRHGYDINIMHLNPEIKSILEDPMDYDDQFGEWDNDLLDDICGYLKTSITRPLLLVQIVLMEWARNYYDIEDIQLMNELYEGVDKQTKLLLLSHAIYKQNGSHIQYASKYGLIELDTTTLQMILNRIPQINYMDVILDKTDFLEKIINLSTNSELCDNPIVKIINRIKN